MYPNDKTCQFCLCDNFITNSDGSISFHECKIAKKIPEAITFLLDRISSWTNARFDQHLRHEYGDEVANAVIKFLAINNIKPYLPH